MMWMTWRQHRSAAAVGGAVVLAVVGALVVLGITARSNVDQVGLASCLHNGADCSARTDEIVRASITGYHRPPRVCSRSHS